MRLAFLGTPEFAIPSLRALHAAGHDIAMVVSQPDRPRGRGQKRLPSPLRACAQELALPNRTLERGERDDLYRQLLALDLDAAIVVAFGHIVREPLLSGPRLGCLNVHASLLPRWRGAAPIHRALLAGDVESGVCVMQLEAGLDTGPVFARRSTPIGADEVAPRLHDRLAAMGAELLIETLARIEADGLRPEPQAEAGATYAPMLSKEEGSADPAGSAAELARRVRALQPWPGVTLLHGERRLKLLQVERVSTQGTSGQLRQDASGELLLCCGHDALRLVRVQPEGRAAMSGADYWRGAGSKLGDALSSLPDYRAKALD